MTRFDDRQRRLVRLAYHTADPRLRCRILDDLRGPRTASMSPLARKLVRIAFATGDSTLREGIVESVRTAAYSEEFLTWAKGRKHHKPSSGNQVQWSSLNSQEQAEVHGKWQPKEPPKEKGPPDTAGVPVEIEGAVSGMLQELYPRKPENMDALRKMHEKGESWHLPMVAQGAKGGLKFWEARGEGGKITIRWGPVGQWQQSSTAKSVDQALKKYESKAAKGYYDAGPSLAMSFSGGPSGMSADALWDQIEKKYGDDPEKRSQAVRAAVDQLTNLDSADPGQWPVLLETAKGLREKLKASQKKPEKKEPEKPTAKKPPEGATPVTAEGIRDLKEGQSLHFYDASHDHAFEAEVTKVHHPGTWKAYAMVRYTKFGGEPMSLHPSDLQGLDVHVLPEEKKPKPKPKKKPKKTKAPK
ncbi:MAG: hypothetical protein KAJ19_21460, partial [Gammaproteobacteria bacterium]|nr:hypothetical protein [Gammaproteobacteria bacterium]